MAILDPAPDLALAQQFISQAEKRLDPEGFEQIAITAFLDGLEAVVTSGDEDHPDALIGDFLGERDAILGTRQHDVDDGNIDVLRRQRLSHFNRIGDDREPKPLIGEYLSQEVLNFRSILGDEDPHIFSDTRHCPRSPMRRFLFRNKIILVGVATTGVAAKLL
jgi:hypothetical protein